MTKLLYLLGDILMLFAIVLGLGCFLLWLAAGISVDLRILIFIGFAIVSFFWAILAATIGVPPSGLGRPIRIFRMLFPDMPDR